MDPNAEVERIFRHENGENGEEEVERWKRPPSSYGSMKSDIEGMEEGGDEKVAQEAFAVPLPVGLPGSSTRGGTGLQMNRPASPETHYTMTTQQTRAPGAVFDTKSADLADFLEHYDDEEVEKDEDDNHYKDYEDDEDDEDEMLETNSPEPPEPVEPEDTMQVDENSQPGRLHPEQDLPHIFKSIQSSLTGFKEEELFTFMMDFCQWELKVTRQQMMEGDLLDSVDKMLEILGQDRALLHTIRTLENINKKEEADELKNTCRRALIRHHLQQNLIGKYQIIREGVVRAGRQNLLNNIYVEPLITICGPGGVAPSHEFLRRFSSPLQVPSADASVGLNDLFRLRKDGKPVRTVVTTGIPGTGMSVSVGKFSLDWAERLANKDLQFVIKLSFRTFRLLRNNELRLSQEISIMEVIEYYHPECKDMKHLEEEDCKFLIIMDSFDCYQGSLDWQNAPVINDNYTKAHPDVLIVNIIRGTVLRGARVWILGRRAAVSQIPSQYIDVVTEIQGFSDEKKDKFLQMRFRDAELSSKIVAHYKRLPPLIRLAQQPFVCWIVATVFERCYRYLRYGEHPPRLTPFYVHITVVQTNRKLQFYYGKLDNELKWSTEDKNLITEIGKMAFKMLEKNTSTFFEEDMKELAGLKLTEVTVFSGLTTELAPAAPGGRRTFGFIHHNFKEFMAALYVFTMFCTKSKNVLGSPLLPKPFLFGDQCKSAGSLLQSAVTRTLAAPPGHYDMFLRFLCGLLSPHCHNNLLCGNLYPQKNLKVGGLDEARRLLERTIRTAEENNRDRVENLKECLREMTQEDE
uniref:NLR family, CARD domain containing 3-like n=2 Tax=Gasterosteus aculeatus TaxID=69293 RepID=G3NYM0_GASAC|nr:NACHT, LRR and PYD domains-containing protein 3 [Gasterosteus aculeatus aculeatus]XP_040045750.1 NACHT, LRR and PYD domains-containing protein 3 [Gasterosteus aculeatus aculeatus]